MEKTLGDLLEEIDKSGKLTVGELKEKGFNDVLIDMAGKYYDMIRLYGIAKPIQDTLNAGDSVTVSPKGYEYLNPIRIKETIEQLDTSIKTFNVSSNNYSRRIDASINEFSDSSDKYSKELVELTRAITIFTIIVVFLTAYPITKALVNEDTLTPLPFIKSNTLNTLVLAALLVALLYSITTSDKLKKLINYLRGSN